MSTPSPRRLTRSRDRRLGGVAAGIAEYLNLDPTLVRIAFAVAVLVGWGFPLLLYVLLWVIMPEAPVENGATPGPAGARGAGRSAAAVVIGVLVALVLAWLWASTWMWGAWGGGMGWHMGSRGFGPLPFGGPLVVLAVVVLIVLLLRDGRAR